MSIFQKACLIIFRCAGKGLEIFMVPDEEEKNPVWSIPKSELLELSEELPVQNIIELDPVGAEKDESFQAVAVEADWHEIPSLRKHIKQDVKLVTEKLKEVMPNLEKGTFVALKDAFKKALPHEYAFLKELKDVITDRNLLKDL